MANDNYPMGTWGGDPRAPWNKPEPECPHCGERVDPDWWFCAWCGERLEGDEQYASEFDCEPPVTRPFREICSEFIGKAAATC